MKAADREQMYADITKHGENLIRIFNLPKKTDPVALCKKLRRLEIHAHASALGQCNGTVGVEDAEKIGASVWTKLNKLGIKGHGLYLNGDPRGYAIKFKAAIKEDIHRDFGGCAIVAPDYSRG